MAVADDRRGKLVLKVSPRVGHPGMRPGDLDPGLVPVPASLLLTRQGALRAPEFLLRPSQELRGGDLAAVGQHREVGQPEVDADHRSSLGKRARRGLDDEAGEVAARRVPDHGHAGRLGGQFPGPAHRHVPDLRQPQPPAGEILNRALRGEPDRLPVILAGFEAGRRDLRAFPLAGDGGEEVPVRRVQVREGLLEHHRGHLAQPGPLRGGLRRGQPGRQLRCR